ncbi:radical SAM protein [Thermosulfuriphilus sp.]
MRLVLVEKKTSVLRRPDFRCLKAGLGINVTRGCGHACLYCYARAFPQAPKDEVWLYTNLPRLLEKELFSRVQRGRLPRWVAFSTASDCFQPREEILEVTYQTMALLLRYGVGVSFLTKGSIPERFWRLFREYRSLVRGRVGLVTVDYQYWRIFEPGTAPPARRLAVIERLLEDGLEVSVRIDPIIPGLTDSPGMIEQLLKRLAGLGVKEVSASYLVLRPGIKEVLASGLPRGLWSAIRGYFWGQPWQRVITSAMTKLVKPMVRVRGYRILKEIGRLYGIKVRVCGCKNPDLPFESCNPWPVLGESGPRQLSLFTPSIDRSPEGH